VRTLRFKHHPSGHNCLIDPARGRVYGVKAGVATITLHDQVVRGAFAGVAVDDLLSAARDFEILWKWPAPGTRFPPAPAFGEGFPDAWFGGLEGRLNRSGPLGDLEFGGFLDREEEERLASGAGVATQRSALERHLSALDYRLRGRLGLVDLYRSFSAHRLRPPAALKKAIGALIVFGRGRSVEIAKIVERRPAARTRGFDERGDVNPDILAQYRRLFDATPADEIDQVRFARFNASNFQSGFISNEQWQTFFATCTALNQRRTVTWKQLVSLFEGRFAHVAASRAGADGCRPLDRVLPD
jgi:hypothetical protein